MLDQLKPDLLASHIGTTFDILNDPANVFSLTLKSVVEHEKTKHNQAFSLFFHGPPTPFLHQAIYTLKHTELGEFEIFLVPVTREQDGFEYEAVFTRMF